MAEAAHCHGSHSEHISNKLNKVDITVIIPLDTAATTVITAIVTKPTVFSQDVEEKMKRK